MIYEEYEKQIKNIISNPDTAMADISGVLETLKSDLEAGASMVEENGKLKDRIRDLQDTNAKLFLGTTGKNPDDTDNEDDNDDDLEGVDALENFVKKFLK